MMPAWMGRKLADFGALWPAEKRVADEMWDGRVVVIGEDVPSDDAPKEVHLRASFVRYLALGGCDRLKPPDGGVAIWGAYIHGDGPEEAITQGLHLDGARLCADMYLSHCRFPDRITLAGSSCGKISFTGSVLSKGLNGESANIKGSVDLSNTKCSGQVRFGGANIDGQLVCDGTKIDGGVSIVALNLQDAKIRTSFILRNGANLSLGINLSHAEIGSIVDELDCWPKGALINLSQCNYSSFAGSSINAKYRLDWLNRQIPVRDYGFDPQPYEQCAKVMRSMGYAADALVVLIEKERLQRRARRLRLPKLVRPFWWLKDQALNLSVRYGRRPLLAFAWLMLFWGIGWGMFEFSARHDAVKPNAVYVLRAPEWVRCGYTRGELRETAVPGALQSGLAGAGQSQLNCYLSRDEAQNYPVFTPWVYSADTLLPIVDLEMQSYWIPDESKPFGKYARWYLWFQIFAGWALSLLAVAGFSGLIKTDSTT